jgi:hypothetical protein
MDATPGSEHGFKSSPEKWGLQLFWFEEFRDDGFAGARNHQLRLDAMNRPSLDIRRRWLAVDGPPEHVEHPRENPFAHRRS